MSVIEVLVKDYFPFSIEAQGGQNLGLDAIAANAAYPETNLRARSASFRK